MTSSSPSSHPFAILSWGGIGDTLRNLSLIPHADFHQRFGIQVPVIHQPWQEIGCREDALPPGPAAIRDLVDRCPSLRWGGVGTLNPLAKNLSRVVRLTLQMTNLGTPPMFPMQINLADSEKVELPMKGNQFCVGVQTHLLGMPSKIWSITKWQRFLELLRNKLPYAHIHLIEPSPLVSELLLDKHFYSHRSFHIAQSIRLVRQMNYVISVCSWVKYVAAWERIPQSIIVPRISEDYAQVNAKSLLRYDYASLKTLPEVLLVGLDRELNKLTLPRLMEVKPESIFNAIESHVR